MEEAIRKINEEMQNDPSNEYLEILGHYIIDRCSDEKVSTAVNGGKTLKGALEAVRNAAKKKGGNCVVMKDNDIFNAVDCYLSAGIDEEARRKAITSVDGVSLPEKKPVATINMDFDSLFE